MLKNEIKIIFKRKLSYFIIIIAIFSSILLPLISFQSFSYTSVDKSGNKIHYNGLKAVNVANELQKEIYGNLDKNVIRKSLETYYNSVDKNTNEVHWNETFSKYVPINELLLYFIEDETYKNLEKDQAINEIADNFYSKRTQMQKKAFEEMYNGKELDYANKLEVKMIKPFQFYGVNGWDSFLMFFSYLIKLYMLLGIIFMATIYTKEKESEFVNIIKSTKMSYVDYKTFKLFASLIYFMGISILGIVIYILMGFKFLNSENLKTSIQFIQLFSPQPMKLYHLLVKMVLYGILGIFSTLILTSMVSDKLKKGRNVAILMVTLFIIYILANGLVDIPFVTIKALIDFLPFRFSDIYYILLEGVNIYTLKNFMISAEKITLIGSILILVFYFFRKKYTKK